MKFDLIVIIIILITKLSTSLIFLPFRIEKNLDGHIFSYNINANIEIGSPPQKIDCSISFEIADYYLKYKSNDTNYVFNKSLSNSFIKVSASNISTSEYSKGFLGSDNLYFYTDIECKNKTLFESFPIILPSDENQLLILNIGLQILNENDNSKALIYNLKSRKIINNSIWSIKFNRFNEGIIIFGRAPHEYENKNSIYNKNNLIFINTINDNNKLFWGFNFDSVKISNLAADKNIKGKINPIFHGFISSYNFLLEVENFYFKQYENENICFRSNINIENNFYIKIVCLKEKFNEKDIQQFPLLSFFNSEFNYSFIFQGRELFLEEEENIVFNIFFKNGLSEDEWIIGRIFLMKYQVVFDNDNKLIGFYKNNDCKINCENKKINEEKNRNYLVWILIVVFLLLFVSFIFLGYFLYKNGFICLKKKKIATELIDDENFIGF